MSDALRQKARNPGAKRLPVSRDQIPNFVDGVLSRQQPVDNLHSAVRSDILCYLIDIAARTGKKLQWNNQKESIVSHPDAAKMMHRNMRRPWTL